MRAIFSWVGVFSLTLLNATTSLATVIYPTNVNSSSYNTPSHGGFYLQAGSFRSASNAQNYQRQLSTQVTFPVTVDKHGMYHRVLIGPMPTASEMRAVHSTVYGSVPVSMPRSMTVRTHNIASSSKNAEAPIHVNVGSRDKDAALLPQDNLDHFDIIGAVGIATLGVSDAQFRVSSIETDRMLQNNTSWNNFSGQLGIGYVHYLPETWRSTEVTWFPSIEPELNVYYVGGSSIEGNVLQYESRALNNLTYSMPINSTRLMIDGVLTLASMDQFSIYGKGGLGNAWSRIGYSDEFNTSRLNRFNQNTRTDSSFVWEAGAGVQYAFNPRIGLSLEYLYTTLGNQTIAKQGNGATTSIVRSGAFHMNTQAALLGLHVTV